MASLFSPTFIILASLILASVRPAATPVCNNLAFFKTASFDDGITNEPFCEIWDSKTKSNIRKYNTCCEAPQVQALRAWWSEDKVFNNETRYEERQNNLRDIVEYTVRLLELTPRIKHHAALITSLGTADPECKEAAAKITTSDVPKYLLKLYKKEIQQCWNWMNS
jgi:hypothetical protein